VITGRGRLWVMPIGRTTTHRKITPMEEMNEKEWLTVMSFTCLIVGDFAVSVARSVDYTPETLQQAEQALTEAQEGRAHAENGSAIVDALLGGIVTARSAQALEMLATMLDITEWHYSYLTRHLTPTEEMEEKYLLAKDAIARLANS